MIPSATYRIQFRNGMTFDRVVALVPYLKDLGISHLYASPCLRHHGVYPRL
jgi:(1->4)-alpha-D-glucan 1-alpha-D-glucosylmutase